ncbi:MAG: hypothetical protein GY822_14480 [Deltaproteobacteria bacterium]|nr:hypothetical protein [Deltaproteobacteria bacterium]
MAKLVPCKECAHDVSKKAKTCPICGVSAPGVRGVSTGMGCLIIVVAMALFPMLFASIGGVESSERQDQARKVQAIAKAKEQAQVAAMTPKEQKKKRDDEVKRRARELHEQAKQLGLAWNYSDSADGMAKGKVKHAFVKSLNTVSFDFPYSGLQRGQLMLRKHPRHGKDVIFSIEKGQILCPSYKDCLLTIRFDDKKSGRFSAVGSSDNSSTTVFIRNYKRFLAKAKRAKTARIEVPFYREGNQVFEFDVSGLKWK